eukprot:TRINITY_DN108432_c0_g1_i3.p1 TRINITY_DN108432_c0_g1~~TRINITY_DN108432_c0_g1_i3.p1  ORF type:complete len:142 (-),score=6.88 TRINITY_DN108432_c0_g1_i3:118-543(-)
MKQPSSALIQMASRGIRGGASSSVIPRHGGKIYWFVRNTCRNYTHYWYYAMDRWRQQNANVYEMSLEFTPKKDLDPRVGPLNSTMQWLFNSEEYSGVADRFYIEVMSYVLLPLLLIAYIYRGYVRLEHNGKFEVFSKWRDL